MEKPPQAALVFAGAVSRGSLIRLPGLRRQLQFVKSSSLATASRAVQALRSGKAVRTFEELASADLLLISVPERVIPTVVAELCSSVLVWENRTVVLFDSDQDSDSLKSLAQRGARTATLTYQPRPEQFLVEGHPDAIRRIRVAGPVPLVSGVPLTLLESKKLYVRAMRSATEGFYPLLASVLEDLRKAGMERATAERTASAVMAETARSYFRAGHRIYRSGPVKPSSPQVSSPESKDGGSLV